jgi:hypothetical protein
MTRITHAEMRSGKLNRCFRRAGKFLQFAENWRLQRTGDGVETRTGVCHFF